MTVTAGIRVGAFARSSTRKLTTWDRQAILRRSSGGDCAIEAAPESHRRFPPRLAARSEWLGSEVRYLGSVLMGALPQTGRDNKRFFLTEAGLETDFIFRRGVDLPDFATFLLLDRPGGEQLLLNYHREFIDLAQRYDVGLILETVTWRSGADWGAKYGYDAARLAEISRRSVDLLREVSKNATVPVVLAGSIGPRGDGYAPGALMSPEAACAYHLPQIQSLQAAGADFISAMTLNYVDEAIGIVNASNKAAIPVTISFTVEVDGLLPSGQTVESAVAQVDQAAKHAPAYYLINCAHPIHIANIQLSDSVSKRIRGLRVNASKLSHAELDKSETLDDGDPEELGKLLWDSRRLFADLVVVGGCCGTDKRHLEAICLQKPSF